MLKHFCDFFAPVCIDIDSKRVIKGGVAAAISPCPTMLPLSGKSFVMVWNHIPMSLKVPMSPYMVPRP